MAHFDQATIDAIKQVIVDQAQGGVASVSVGGQSVTAIPVKDLLAMLDSMTTAADQPHFGLRFTKLNSPATG